jgi:hypothetical protein
MTFPTVTEQPLHLEPVVRDSFMDDEADLIAAARRAASWPWPNRRRAED